MDSITDSKTTTTYKGASAAAIAREQWGEEARVYITPNPNRTIGDNAFMAQIIRSAPGDVSEVLADVVVRYGIAEE